MELFGEIVNDLKRLTVFWSQISSCRWKYIKLMAVETTIKPKKELSITGNQLQACIFTRTGLWKILP